MSKQVPPELWQRDQRYEIALLIDSGRERKVIEELIHQARLLQIRLIRENSLGAKQLDYKDRKL